MPEAQFRDLLDDISDCFTTRNFAGWEARIVLPFTLITRRGPEVFTTRDALEANFEHYLVACDILRIDMIHRKQISLEESENDMMIGTYETNLLSNGKRATEPYVSSVLLELTPDGMKMRSILNARGHHDWTGKR